MWTKLTHALADNSRADLIRKTVFVLIAVFLFSGCNQKKQEQIPFSQNKWIEGDWRTRGKMVDHIIRDSLLIGKTADEAQHMLGGDSNEPCDGLSYPVDIGLRTGPFGLGGTWLFFLNVYVDSVTCRVTDVRCLD